MTGMNMRVIDRFQVIFRLFKNLRRIIKNDIDISIDGYFLM